MRVVVALGGNALQKRDEPMTVQNQRRNVRLACEVLAPIAREHSLVVTHGNGPQVGLLALQAASFDEASSYPFDVLGAQTEGMIGYWIEQELGNLLPFDKPLATLLTMTEVDPDDPAFADPTKFVGPGYSEADAQRLAAERGWTVRQDGERWRRVVPSPQPRRIFERRPIEWLLERDTVVVCAGGGGIPTMYLKDAERTLVGVDAVIDKDRATAVLARDIHADLLAILTDAEAIYVDWGTPQQRAIASVGAEAIAAMRFPAGSMGPKVEAAVQFVRETGNDCYVGALPDLPGMLEGAAGTRISLAAADPVYR